jgi:hypothetical protein
MGYAGSVGSRALIGFVQKLLCLVDGAPDVISGFHRELVLLYGSFALACEIEDLAQLQIPPDFGPARLPIAMQRIPAGVRAGLEIMLGKKNFGDAVVDQGALWVSLKLFL